MKQTTLEIQVLRPEAGHYLTQVSLKENEQRAFSTSVYLAASDAPENWQEVDEAYKQQWEEEHAQANE